MPPNFGGESEGKMIEPKFRYLDAKEVCVFRGDSLTSLYDDIKAGRFPQGELHGPNRRRWRSDVVAAWLEERSRNAQALAEDAARKAKARSRLGVEAKRRKAAERATQEANHAPT